MTERWLLEIEVDPLEEQSRSDPELHFPNDEISQIVHVFTRAWGLIPEDISELMTWDSTKITVQVEILDHLVETIPEIIMRSIPRKITLTRQEPRN